VRIGIGAQLLSYPLVMRGGIGTYMRNILRELPAAARERGHRLELFWGAEGPELARELGIGGDDVCIRHHISPIPMRQRGLRLPYEQAVLPFQARRQRVRVFHFLDYSISALPPAPGVVSAFHDVIPLIYRSTYGQVRGSYKAAMSWLSARLSTLIIANSHATKRDLVTLLGVAESRIRVVYYGLNPIFRRVDNRDVLEAARARYGLPQRFLVCVSTLEPRKNIERIMRAYAEARQRHGLTIPLVFIGQRGWGYESMLHLPAELGIEDDLVFAGYAPQQDLPAIYSLADALVYTTLYEGFGLPALEALGCGTIPIASNLSSIPEVVGDLGLLVDPYRTEAIAEAMYRSATDRALRDRLLVEGPTRAKRFSWERAARETVSVYEEAAR
jgi:glycosyltransferase involved in cell wall biosynthesis